MLGVPVQSGGDGVEVTFAPHLDLRSVQVDNFYQRMEKAAWISRKADEFDRLAVGVLHVSVRADGSMWVVDGQQRTTLCLRCGLTSVPALLYHGLTRIGEADLYLALNDSSDIKAKDLFRAKISAEDEDMLALFRVATMAGWKVDGMGEEQMKQPHLSSLVEQFYKTNGTLRGVSALMDHFQTGLPAVDLGLRFLSEFKVARPQAPLMSGAIYFADLALRADEWGYEFDQERFNHVVGATQVNILRRYVAGEQGKVGGAGHSKVPHYYFDAMVVMYNGGYGRKEVPGVGAIASHRELPDWKTYRQLGRT